MPRQDDDGYDTDHWSDEADHLRRVVVNMPPPSWLNDEPELEPFDDPADRALFDASLQGPTPATGQSPAPPLADQSDPDCLALVPSSDGSIEHVRWLEPNLWPVGFLSILAGIGGLGKSTYTYSLTAAVTTGKTRGEWAGKPRSVVIFSAEDTWTNVIRPRLIAAGADLTLVFFVASPADIEAALIDIPDDLEVLERLISDRGDVALVVFDPLVAFLGDDTDTHRDHSTRRALRPLGDFAARLGSAVIGVMHLNKGSGTDLYHRLSMSVAFYNTVRSAVLFAQDPDAPETDYRILAQDKNNFAEKAPASRWRIESATAEHGTVSVDTSRLVYAGVSDLDANQLIDVARRDGGDKTQLASEKLQEWWWDATGPVSVKSVETMVAKFNREQPETDDRISIRTFRRALKMLGGDTRKEGFSTGGWVWAPPEGFFDGSEATDDARVVT